MIEDVHRTQRALQEHESVLTSAGLPPRNTLVRATKTIEFGLADSLPSNWEYKCAMLLSTSKGSRHFEFERPGPTYNTDTRTTPNFIKTSRVYAALHVINLDPSPALLIRVVAHAAALKSVLPASPSWHPSIVWCSTTTLGCPSNFEHSAEAPLPHVDGISHRPSRSI